MRLNVDLPDWIYLKFRRKVGNRNMSANIKNYILFSTCEGGSEDVFEMKKNLDLLKKRLEETEVQVNLVWIQYQEAQQLRDQVKQDVQALDSYIEDKTKQLEKEEMEKQKVESEIKFNTMKERLGDI